MRAGRTSMQGNWASIIGYEGKYEVSDLGRIRSLNRWITTKDGKKKLLKAKYYSMRYDSKGYVITTLYGDKTKTFRVHRLVATAFIENPNNYKIVNHIDNTRGNNKVDNLQWCTSSQNTKHMYDTGVRVGKSGKDSTNFKGAVEVLDKEGNILDTLIGDADMKSKGYNPTCICNVLAGRRSTHRNKTFRRIEP